MVESADDGGGGIHANEQRMSAALLCSEAQTMNWCTHRTFHYC